MAVPAPTASRFDALVIGLAVVVGAGLSVWLWRSAEVAEASQNELAFSRQIEARHAFIRQTLAGYEDCLLAMRVFMAHGREIDQAKFGAVARGQFERHPGFLGMQWAPRVAAENRADWERAHAALLGKIGRIRERATGRIDVVALPRSEYFPMQLAEPLDANRHVLGSDAAASPLRAIFGAAAASGDLALSGKLKLVYESGPNDGLVMVCPVPGTPGRVDGFLLGVFRVADLLNQPWNMLPGSPLDVMFLDGAAPQADRRVLYCHLGHESGRPPPTEEEFRRRPHREVPLTVAGRRWSLLYRRAEEPARWQVDSPLVGLVAGLAATFFGAFFLGTHLRRTRSIEGEVKLRTVELSESRRQLAHLMHALPGMAFRGEYADTFAIAFISEGVLRLTGYPPADFLSGRVHLRDLVHPEDVARVRTGTRAALAERREFEVEYRIRTRAGAERWLLSRGRGVYVDGQPPVFEGLAIDITAQKQAEADRLALERKLLEGQKLESLGLLAGSIAHDFNNLLSTVLGSAELARLALPAGHATEAKLQAIESAAMRASELCRQLLAYAGKGRLVIELVDLSALTEELVPLLKVSIARAGQLRLDLARGLPAVSADATQIRQIVMNLVLNATDAVAGREGEVVIRTSLARVGTEDCLRCVVGTSLPVGDYVCLEVVDNGVGMTPEVRAKIFDPFFTTKFSGRGLGLAAVLGIVRGHGGALCVDSSPGRGSTFRLLLPPSSGPAPSRGGAPVSAGAGQWRHRGGALVVDDEPQVREVMCEMLRGFGFLPVEAADGRAAVELFRAEPARFDLVVLDLLMPGKNGEQTLAELRTVLPDVRVLLISGHTDEELVQRLGGAGRIRFLGKPFSRTSLERALRGLLG
ncbi:MAG: CHASE domain-containing protein [Verrucomicrobia bacterium]|nr:CHASE domain-containing protein [Verrucomicrobiota bacterium]